MRRVLSSHPGAARVDKGPAQPKILLSMRGLSRIALPGAFSGALLAAALAGGVAPAVAAELTIDQELRIGSREYPLILQRYGGEYGDPALRAYVSDVGKRVVAAITPATPYDFVFTILDNSDAYAFAMPGGYIYITRQMVALANSEAELAAVLAHEVAHIALRHANQRTLLQDELKGATAAYSNDQMHAFTRDQEIDADVASIRLLAVAGYDPFAQARFLATVGQQADLVLRAGEPAPRDPDTHPAIVDRVRRAYAEAKKVEQQFRDERDKVDVTRIAGYVPVGDAAALPWNTRREPFLRAIDGMVYGRRPAEGMIVGNTYYDSTNRFSFSLPPGFHFSNAGRSVGADGPNGASMKFDVMVNRVAPTEGMLAYVRRNVAGAFDVLSLEERPVDGGAMAAVLGRAQVFGVGGQAADVLFAWVRVTPTAFFRFQFFVPGTLSPEMADRVLETPMSLRRLTDAEARAVTPLRIQVMPVPADTEVEALAAQMRMVDHPLEWLRVLNHLDPGANPKAGDLIKLVAQ